MHIHTGSYNLLPKKSWNLFIKKIVLFTLTCFNFSHLQSTLHLMQYNYGDIFSIAQNRFWTWFWCLLVLLLFFALPLPHCQNVTFEDFFHLGKQKNSRLGQIRWMGEWDTGTMPFLVKNCWTLSTVWAGVLIKHPPWNGQTHWKHLQKNSLKLNASTASHNNASWYTNTDGFLEHSPSGGEYTHLYYKGPTIQKIIPVVWAISSRSINTQTKLKGCKAIFISNFHSDQKF